MEMQFGPPFHYSTWAVLRRVCVDDEHIYIFIPFSCFGTGVCESNILDAVKDYDGSFEKGVYKFGRKHFDFLGAYVETL